LDVFSTYLLTSKGECIIVWSIKSAKALQTTGLQRLFNIQLKDIFMHKEVRITLLEVMRASFL